MLFTYFVQKTTGLIEFLIATVTEVLEQYPSDRLFFHDVGISEVNHFMELIEFVKNYLLLKIYFLENKYIFVVENITLQAYN